VEVTRDIKKPYFIHILLIDIGLLID